MRQRRRRHNRRVSDPYAVVQLIFFLEPAQDRNRVLDGWLADEHRLKPPLQCRVLFDIFAIFVERRRADAMQFATRQGGLDHVRCVHRAVGFACTDQRVHLVDEQDDLPLGTTHFVEHAFEPFLEFAAVFSACDQRAHVERHQVAALDAIGHVAIGNPQRQPFRNRGLPDAGFADQHRVIFRPPRENLDCPADFLVATDHGVELAVACRLRQVARILLERVIAVLGRLCVRRPSAAQLVDRRIQGFGLQTCAG